MVIEFLNECLGARSASRHACLVLKTIAEYVANCPKIMPLSICLNQELLSEIEAGIETESINWYRPGESYLYSVP